MTISLLSTIWTLNIKFSADQDQTRPSLSVFLRKSMQEINAQSLANNPNRVEVIKANHQHK